MSPLLQGPPDCLQLSAVVPCPGPVPAALGSAEHCHPLPRSPAALGAGALGPQGPAEVLANAEAGAVALADAEAGVAVLADAEAAEAPFAAAGALAVEEDAAVGTEGESPDLADVPDFFDCGGGFFSGAFEFCPQSLPKVGNSAATTL